MGRSRRPLCPDCGTFKPWWPNGTQASYCKSCGNARARKQPSQKKGFLGVCPHKKGGDDEA